MRPTRRNRTASWVNQIEYAMLGGKVQWDEVAKMAIKRAAIT